MRFKIPNRFFFAGPLAFLLGPLAAMQLTEEVKWSAADFVVAAVLLYGAGFSLRTVQTRSEQGSSFLAGPFLS